MCPRLVDRTRQCPKTFGSGTQRIADGRNPRITLRERTSLARDVLDIVTERGLKHVHPCCHLCPQKRMLRPPMRCAPSSHDVALVVNLVGSFDLAPWPLQTLLMLLVGETRQLRMAFVQRSVPFDCDRPLMSIAGSSRSIRQNLVSCAVARKKTTPTVSLD